MAKHFIAALVCFVIANETQPIGEADHQWMEPVITDDNLPNKSPRHPHVFNLPELCWLFLLSRVSVMNTLLWLVIAPALLSAQLSYQVGFCWPRDFRENPFAEERFICTIFQGPESSVATDDENPNYGLTLPVKRTYVLHRGPNGEPRW